MMMMMARMYRALSVFFTLAMIVVSIHKLLGLITLLLVVMRHNICVKLHLACHFK